MLEQVDARRPLVLKVVVGESVGVFAEGVRERWYELDEPEEEVRLSRLGGVGAARWGIWKCSGCANVIAGPCRREDEDEEDEA